jgi:hypothetical protein
MEFAKKNNILTYKVDASSQRGFPDLLLIFPSGHVTFVELKSPKGTGKLRPEQIRTHEKLRRNNADVFSLDSLDTFKTLISERLSM